MKNAERSSLARVNRRRAARRFEQVVCVTRIKAGVARLGEHRDRERRIVVGDAQRADRQQLVALHHRFAPHPDVRAKVIDPERESWSVDEV